MNNTCYSSEIANSMIVLRLQSLFNWVCSYQPKEDFSDRQS